MQVPSLTAKQRNSDIGELCSISNRTYGLTSFYYVFKTSFSFFWRRILILNFPLFLCLIWVPFSNDLFAEDECKMDSSSLCISDSNQNTEKEIRQFFQKYYEIKTNSSNQIYKELYCLYNNINTCFEKIEERKGYDRGFWYFRSLFKERQGILKEKKLLLELGELSNKIKLDLKKYELSATKTVSTKDSANKIIVVSELDVSKKETELKCSEENNSPIYLDIKHQLFHKIFQRKLCNFGILPVGMTGLVVQGQDSYISKAYINPYGLIDVKEQGQKQTYAFYSSTAYYKGRFFDIFDRDIIFVGLTAGIGLGKDSSIKTDSPSLMAGLSAGITLDDTKFFAITYGNVWDPNTHQLPSYLPKYFPASAYFSEVSGIKSNLSLSQPSFTQNNNIEVPLKTVMGLYQGWGFSFSYKF